MIRGVHQVVLPVRDQDEAKAFWTKAMGFELVQDTPYGDERWLEVACPDGHVNLVLDLQSPMKPAPDVPAHLPQSNVMFYCDDLRQTYEELTRRGVTFAAAPSQQPFGWWSMFEDQDGTRYALGQASNTSS